MAWKNSWRWASLLLLGWVVAALLGGATARAAGPGADGGVQLLWHTYYATATEENAGGIATDADGNVYVVGTSDAAWQGDNGANPLHAFTGQMDLFVLKLDHSGAYRWHTFYAGGEYAGAGAIRLDAAGNIYVTGYSMQAWLGDGDAPPLHAGGNDFVLKLNRNGAYRWHTFYKMGMGALALDPHGHVLVAGNSTAAWRGDGGTPPLHAFTGPTDMTVLQLNDQGAYQWHTFYGPAGTAGIAAGSDDGVYVAGTTGESWDGEGGALPRHAYSGAGDVALLALTGRGAYRWHTFYGSADEDSAGNVAVDPQDYLYLTGASKATWLGNGDTAPRAPHQDNEDTLLLKLDRWGAYQWHTFAGTDLADHDQHLALDRNGAPHVTQTRGYTYIGDMCPTISVFCQYWFMDVLKFSTEGAPERTYAAGVVGDPSSKALATVDLATDRDNNNVVLAAVMGCEPDCFQGTRVRAYAGGTDLAVVKTNLAEPPPPALVKPANKAVVKLAKPMLDWSDAANATQYHLQLVHGTRTGTVVADTLLAESAFKSPALTRGERYFWRVQACGDNGCSVWSGWRRFTVKAK